MKLLITISLFFCTYYVYAIMFHVCLNSDGGFEEGISGSSSNFTTVFKKPLSVPSFPNGQWGLALYSARIPNTIPNISSSYNNNKFYYSVDSGVTWKTIVIASGYYQVEQLSKYIEAAIKENGDQLAGGFSPIRLEENGSRMRVVLYFHELAVNYRVKFDPTETLGTLLGFTPGIYSDLYEGDNIPDINRNINTLYIMCSATSAGSGYRNGIQSNCIFAVNLYGAPGSIMDVSPQSLLWVSLGATDQDIINEWTIRVVDYRGRDVDFNGAPTAFTFGLKKIYYNQNE